MDGENVLPVPGWDRPCPLWDIWPHVCRPGQWRGGLSDSETGGFCMATASFWGIGLTGLTGSTGLAGLKVTGDAEVGEVGLRTAWSRGAAKRCGKMLKDAQSDIDDIEYTSVYISVHQYWMISTIHSLIIPYHYTGPKESSGNVSTFHFLGLLGHFGSLSPGLWSPPVRILPRRGLLCRRRSGRPQSSETSCLIQREWALKASEGIWRHLRHLVWQVASWDKTLPKGFMQIDEDQMKILRICHREKLEESGRGKATSELHQTSISDISGVLACLQGPEKEKEANDGNDQGAGATCASCASCGTCGTCGLHFALRVSIWLSLPVRRSECLFFLPSLQEPEPEEPEQVEWGPRNLKHFKFKVSSSRSSMLFMLYV